MTRTDERGRLTPVDVVFFGLAVSVAVFLGEPLYQLLSESDVGPGTTLLFRMILPALVATILIQAYRTSLIGGGV